MSSLESTVLGRYGFVEEVGGEEIITLRWGDLETRWDRWNTPCVRDEYVVMIEA